MSGEAHAELSATADAFAAPRAVLIEERDSIVLIRLNRPAERNSLSLATLHELESAMASLAARAKISAIIFTGTEEVFASGANLSEVSTLTPGTARAFAERGQRLMHLIAAAQPLTIAAVNGYCMGGGLDLALACDLRFASSSAVFAHPGARRGIITGWGGTQRLPRLIGAARALEIFMTARRVGSAEAYAIGLVDRICDPVADCACDAVREFAP